jgi:hypothetical protein
MPAPRTVEPSLRFGDVGARWGNLVAPAGELAVDDAFVFRGEDGGVQLVRRVLSFPGDSARRLVHYESAAR